MWRAIRQQVTETYNGEPMQFELEMPWIGFRAFKDDYPNWFYALGGFSYTYTAVVDVIPPSKNYNTATVNITYQLHVFD